MVLNPEKSKTMIINYCTSLQFCTRLEVNNSILEQVNQTRLLGVIISDDMSWQANTSNLVQKAYKRMTILRKLNQFKVSIEDMLKIYVLYIRSIIEQSSVVWSSSLTQQEENSLERVQKIALRIVYQENYISYENALQMSNFTTIKKRFEILLYRFAVKCVKTPKTQHMIPFKKEPARGRRKETYEVPIARKERLFKSSIPTMARLLNKNPVHK